MLLVAFFLRRYRRRETRLYRVPFFGFFCSCRFLTPLSFLFVFVFFSSFHTLTQNLYALARNGNTMLTDEYSVYRACCLHASTTELPGPSVDACIVCLQNFSFSLLFVSLGRAGFSTICPYVPSGVVGSDDGWGEGKACS